MAVIFRPFGDPKRFPILSSRTGNETLVQALMACDRLLTMAPESVEKANMIGRSPGYEWHEYGDTRWPDKFVWIEFPFTNPSEFQLAGTLVVRHRIPEFETDPFAWVSQNHPMAQVFPRFATRSTTKSLRSLLSQKINSEESIPEPEDTDPAHVQSYCLYGKGLGDGEPQQIGVYTDILNKDGVPITRFRTAEIKIQNIPWCCTTLSALFHLNAARIEGFQFQKHRQIAEFSPVTLSGDQPPAKWTAFHPCRMLRLRPAVRMLSAPRFVDGLIDADTFQAVQNTRRQEANSELLAFDRLTRPRDLSLQNLDSNVTLGAFVHRANGAAIYVLPKRLVAEFDKTDCSEVRIADLRLPFSNLYLKFTPVEPVALADGAYVDGCYLVRQGSEILFCLTSRIQNIDYEKSFSLTCIDPTFSLHLPAHDPEMTVNQAVELGIEEFRLQNAPPEEDLSRSVERPDGMITELVDVRGPSRKRRIERFESQEPAFRTCLNIIVNAACFIASRPDDLESTWEGRPPDDLLARSTAKADSRAARDRRAGALRRIDNGDFTKVKICGRKLFDENPDPAQASRGYTSPRSHWRRGHWRRQRHGSGLAKISLRWIRPTLVKGEAGSPVETRLYDVSDDPSS